MVWRLVLGTILTVFLASAAHAQPVTSPERNNPLRAELLDALRPTIQAETGGPVSFVVGTINVMGEWAYIGATPVRRNGSPIDWRATKFREAFDADMFSGLVMALLRRDAKGWTVVAFVVGPTDVYWYDWVEKYKLPEALFAGP